MEQSDMPRNIFKYTYYKASAVLRNLLELANPSQITDYKKIPIIINNFNRVGYLKKLLESLEKRGYSNIHIIDNFSTYPPLLEFYDTCGYNIFRLKKNLGAYALWKSGLIKKFNKDYFVYTDSDVVPLEECPDDFLLFFLNTLKRHKYASKAGFSLKIDDIPDCFTPKKAVIDHEQTFSRFFISEESVYYAPIDTTFALYRPRTSWKHANYNIEIYRTAYPYMARHLPWYLDSDNPDEETLYYLDTANKTATWIRKDKVLSDRRNSKK
jgi:glycosyltransferase involved in cell wall biosynthesis